jgi:hypothetical protein
MINLQEKIQQQRVEAGGSEMKKSLLLAIWAVFLLTGISHADTLTLVQAGLVNGSNVTVYLPPGDSVPTFAAYYQLNFNSVNYMGYCVDYANINWDTPYDTFSMITIPNNDVRYREAAYLFEKYGQSSPSWGKEVQLAIWEVVFDQGDANHSVSPNSGLFYVTDPGSAKLGTVQDYVNDAINNGRNFDVSGYRLLVSPIPDQNGGNGYYGKGQQDFLVKTPEPGMLALLGISLLGLFLAARRKIIS